MQAVTVIPLEKGSVDLTDLPDPPEADGPVLVKTRAIGVCGTDIEIIAGDYGWAPPGEDRLAIGHESLGEVLEAPDGLGLARGRPGGRHRPPPGPGALRELRGRGVGHVPQRQVHRVGHQGTPRLCPGAIPDPRRFRREG